MSLSREMSLSCDFEHCHVSENSLQDIAEVTSDLFNGVIARCRRTTAMKHTRHVAHLAVLIDAGAWTDAALALLALELPQWQLRRLAYDDGEWHCALSDNRELPDWLDASIETHHADMPLAILSAILEAQQAREASHLGRSSTPNKDRSVYEPLNGNHFA